jgi:hypothetical protein
MSTTKCPDFIIKVSKMKRPDLGDVLKIGKCIFAGVNDLLHTIGVQIPAKIFRLPHGPALGRTNGAHVKVLIFSTELGVLCD